MKEYERELADTGMGSLFLFLFFPSPLVSVGIFIEKIHKSSRKYYKYELDFKITGLYNYFDNTYHYNKQ